MFDLLPFTPSFKLTSFYIDFIVTTSVGREMSLGWVISGVNYLWRETSVGRWTDISRGRVRTSTMKA